MGGQTDPGKVRESGYNNDLAKMGYAFAHRSKKAFDTAFPLYNEMTNQTLEGLKTGGIGAQIPTIQRAVEASKLATGAAAASARDRLNGAGLGGTPFGERNINDIYTQGALQQAQLPTQIVENRIAGGPGLAGLGFGTSGQMGGLGSGSLSNAAQLDIQRQEFNAAQFAKFMEDVKDTLQSAYGGKMGGMCCHPDTLLETPDGTHRPISELRVGDLVTSLDAAGDRCVGRIVEHQTRAVGPLHVLAILPTPDGDVLVSTSHPFPDGLPVNSSDRAVGWRVGATDRTMDILVDSPTGVYFASGIALGSTLDPRHAYQLRSVG